MQRLRRVDRLKQCFSIVCMVFNDADADTVFCRGGSSSHESASLARAKGGTRLLRALQAPLFSPLEGMPSSNCYQ